MPINNVETFLRFHRQLVAWGCVIGLACTAASVLAGVILWRCW